MEIKTKIFIGFVVALYLLATLSYIESRKKVYVKDDFERIVFSKLDSVKIHKYGSEITKKYYCGINLIYLHIEYSEKFKAADTLMNVTNVKGKTILYTSDIGMSRIRWAMDTLSKKEFINYSDTLK